VLEQQRNTFPVDWPSSATNDQPCTCSNLKQERQNLSISFLTQFFSFYVYRYSYRTLAFAKN